MDRKTELIKDILDRECFVFIQKRNCPKPHIYKLYDCWMCDKNTELAQEISEVKE